MGPISYRMGYQCETVHVHPQWSHKEHAVDSALVGAGSLWLTLNLLQSCVAMLRVVRGVQR
jgi:hypothetical protein